MRAAGAAAADLGALGQLLALLHLEGVAAAARGDGVRVVDLEARTPEIVFRKSIVVPRRYGALYGSTTTGMPSSESSTSPSAAPASKPRPYWKPEQPPPWIATRRTSVSRVVLLGHELPDLRRRDGRQRDQGVGRDARRLPRAHGSGRGAGYQQRVCNTRIAHSVRDFAIPSCARRGSARFRRETDVRGPRGGTTRAFELAALPLLRASSRQPSRRR